MSSNRLPRVLMLHGYTQNAVLFSKRVASIRKACKDTCEMVFVDGPHVIGEPSAGSGAFEVYDSDANAGESPDPEETPRTWWFAKAPEETGSDRRTYIGFEETLRYLRSVVDSQGPFDACLGFSQGAALAAIVAAVLARPSIHPAFSSPPLRSDQGPLKAVIAVAGFKLEEPGTWYAANDKGEGKMPTPSLHILGDTDAIVGDDRALPLVESFDHSRVIRHEGGHYVPAKGPWRQFWNRFFAAIRDGQDVEKVPGPDDVPNETAKM